MVENQNSCKEGVNTIKEYIQNNIKIQQLNNIKIDEYNSLYKLYNQEYIRWKDVLIVDWKTKRNDAYNQLKNEYKLWKNCLALGQCNAYQHSDWCVNDYGTGWEHTGGINGTDSGQDCWAGCRGKCQRTNSKLDFDISQWEIQNPPPIEPLAPVKPVLYPQLNTPDIAINCCDNITNVIGSDLTNTQLDQLNECITNIEKKQESSSTSNTQDIDIGAQQTPVKIQPYKPPQKQETQSQPQLNNTNLILYGSIGLVVLVLLLK